MTTKWAQKAAEKASSRLVFEPSTEDRRKNWCYFRGLLTAGTPCIQGLHTNMSASKSCGTVLPFGALFICRKAANHRPALPVRFLLAA
jgi:hypothetical protein